MSPRSHINDVGEGGNGKFISWIISFGIAPHTGLMLDEEWKGRVSVMSEMAFGDGDRMDFFI